MFSPFGKGGLWGISYLVMLDSLFSISSPLMGEEKGEGENSFEANSFSLPLEEDNSNILPLWKRGIKGDFLFCHA